MFGIPEIAVGAVSAAVIAALVSLLGLIIAKEQKISEFRQAWIDALRSETSALISHVNAIHGAYSAGSRSSHELWKSVRDDFVGINQATANIRLRLNPDEKQSQLALKTIREIENAINHESAAHPKQLNDLEKTLVTQTADILKAEWKRVKRGEPIYRVARYSAIIVLAFAVLGFAALAWRSGLISGLLQRATS